MYRQSTKEPKDVHNPVVALSKDVQYDCPISSKENSMVLVYRANLKESRQDMLLIRRAYASDVCYKESESPELFHNRGKQILYSSDLNPAYQTSI